MLNQCPKCGAELPQDEQCRDRFERCLIMDYEHPDTYGAVHHLIVACYMLQHNAYSRQGWLGARALIVQAIQDGASPRKLREQNRRRLNSGRRDWKITGGEKIAEVNGITWTRTIADVRLDTAENYRADARLWAASVLADTEAIPGV